MKIQLASDLHLEFLGKSFPGTRIIEPAPGADVLVLAGDIHNGTKAIEAFSDWPVPVIYLAGNHEFYGRSWEQTRVDLRNACAGTNITLLDNDMFEFGGVRFLGCTLWTDFRLNGFTQRQCMEAVQEALNDYYVIRTQEGRLQARDTLIDHEQSRRWLEAELAKPYDGKTVVVTHHGPHPLSIHPRYVGDKVSAGFISDLTPLLHHADLWLHGHVHDSFDYVDVGLCRVVANPAGYIRNLSVARDCNEFEFENSEFVLNMVLDV
jgi:Icc-related predicted phosphoesterase